MKRNMKIIDGYVITVLAIAWVIVAGSFVGSFFLAMRMFHP